MNDVLSIIKNKTITYEQKVLALAAEAENSLNVLNITEQLTKLKEADIICDLFEGSAPYRPRYIVPDYELFMKNGSEFLDILPATNIHEATNNLMILYRHVPSITSFPVYIGNLDYLLEPFIEDEEEAYGAIKRFLLNIDRTITDSFCHANIGPKNTKAAALILRAQRELETSIPNMTLKVAKDTPDSLIKDAIDTALITAKPSFANHEMFTSELGADYGIASCYNGLIIGGGAYTLARIKLDKLAKTSKSLDSYLNNELVSASSELMGYMDEKIRFLIEEVEFFKSNFLAREELIKMENFSAMFGLVGLAEAVNYFLKLENSDEKFGSSKRADEIGESIIQKIDELVKAHENKYLIGTNNNYLLHAQVGVDTDAGTSPGCRIPIGDEPEIFDHIKQAAKYHKYFPSGIGDIFNFDETVKKNTDFLLDIIRGAFKNELRYFSAYSTDCDVIRITGYLVKRSEIEKANRGEQVLRDTVALGKGAVDNSKIYERKIRK